MGKGAPLKDRDVFLDIAKGLAIILVVVGHVLQGSALNFDELIGFRVIYSFHMPLFVFLSGAVAAIAFKPDRLQDGFRATLASIRARLSKSAIRLLLPFVAWCIVNELIYHSSNGVISALVLAFRRPDTALWFLLAIFYCVVLLSIFEILFAALYALSKNIACSSCARFLLDGRVQVLLIILIWWLFREHTPRGAGIGLLRPYFIYYVLGMGFYRYLYQDLASWKYFFVGILFIALVPFWSRTAADNFSVSEQFAALPQYLSYFYAAIVALSGSFLMLGITKLIAASKEGWFKSSLVLCGQLSLGIYALHYFFLSYPPKVIAPLLLSIAIAFILNRIPVLRTIFLGEKWRSNSF